MTASVWREEPIGKKHRRDSFDCGEAALNAFLRQYAHQSHEAGGAKTFLAINETDGEILGYFSLAPTSVAYERAPDVVRRGLARHVIPGFRLARLAVDRTVQGQGLGVQLLLAAGRRCLRVSTEIGGVALVIDAKSERAAKWHAALGAVPLLDSPQTLMMPLATLATALASHGKC